MRGAAKAGRSRPWALALVALAAFLAGLAVGHLGADRGPGRPRAHGPGPGPAHPRSLSP
jgi:hypothetical protein